MSIQFPQHRAVQGRSFNQTESFQGQGQRQARPQGGAQGRGGFGQDEFRRGGFGQQGGFERRGVGGREQFQGHRPMGRPGEQFGRQGLPQGRPQVDPTQRAEDLFKQLDTNGDGSVTREEATASFTQQAAKRTQAAPAQPVAAPAETPVEEVPVDTTPVEETPVAAETPADTTTDTEAETTDPGQIQSQVLAQLTTLAGTDGLSDDQKKLLTDAATAVQALDPTSADFLTQLNTALAPLA